MKLYNKIQELITESETLKQKNNEVLELARNELSKLVEEKANENLESLKNTFQGYLNGQLVEIPLIFKKNVKELVDKEALIKEVRNELLSLFDKQAITNDLKRELKNEIKSELGNLLSDRELQSELTQAKKQIVSETTNETTNALTSKILGILETRLNAITESVSKNLDFSFLAAQPKAFYSVIHQNLKAMFLKELESEFLQKYIKESIESALTNSEKDSANIIIAAEKVSKLFIDAGVSLFGKEQIQVVESNQNANLAQMNMSDLLALVNSSVENDSDNASGGE